MKRKLLFIVGIPALLVSGCSTTNKGVCEDVLCTQEFRTVQVSFKDQAGDRVQVRDFSAVIKRTGKPAGGESESGQQGVYAVATDADIRKLSANGDEIVVTATEVIGGKKASASFVIAGGSCACHISKISGPTEIVF